MAWERLSLWSWAQVKVEPIFTVAAAAQPSSTAMGEPSPGAGAGEIQWGLGA